jgi:hypothetical protein
LLELAVTKNLLKITEYIRESLAILVCVQQKLAKFMPDLTAGKACFYTKATIFSLQGGC